MVTSVMSPTLTTLLEDAMNWHLEVKEPDAVLSIETHMFDVQFIAQCMELEFDVGSLLHLNIGRFSRLVKEYVPRTPVERFVAQCHEIVSGNARDGAVAGFLFRDPPRHAKKHRWGGCLQSAQFRRNDRPNRARFTLTFNSRTTYLGYMGHLDACLAYTLASYITDPSKVEFIWNIGSVQLHCFKSLPLIFKTPSLFKILENLAKREVTDVAMRAIKTHYGPTWYYLVKWYQRILRDYDAYGLEMVAVEKYGPFKRVKRRWLEFKGLLTKNIPPSLPVQDLTFDKAIDDEGYVDLGVAEDGDDDE